MDSLCDMSMKSRIILSCVLAWSCLAIPAGARERLYLEQISVSENLPHTDVSAITGDDEGFLWFGTYSGLCRYDGIRMEVFNVTNSILKSSRIRSLYSDGDGMLYIGTETGGLSLYDTREDRFVRTIPVPLNNVNGLFAHDGKVCICTDAGISLLDLADSSFKMDSHWLASGVMGGCSILGKGMVLCTPSGLSFLEEPGLGGGEAVKTLLPGVYCCAAVYLEDKDRIFVTGYDGWYGVDCSDLSWRKLNSYEAISLYETPSGYLWVGTRRDGMVCYDRDFRIVHRYGPYAEYGFNSCDITSFYMDRSDVLWIGTIGNGCYKKIRHVDDFSLYTVSEAAGKDHIVCMYADSADRLWISTRDGNLYVMRRDKDIIRIDPASLSMFNGMPVSFIYEDANGSIWISAWTCGPKIISGDNIGRALEGRHFGFGGFSGNHLLNTASIYMAQSDSFGHLWLSTNYGVFRYVPGEGADGWYAGTWTNFGSDPADSASLADNFCTDILAEDYDGKHYIWIGSRLGLTRFICDDDGDVTSVLRVYPSQNDTGLKGDYISAFHKDKEGNLWIATLGGGLNKLTGPRDASELKFLHYNSGNCAFMTNEFESVQEDANGIFWIGSSRGLVRFDPENGDVKTFLKNDGLQSDVFKIWASGKFHDGRLVFGGPDGFNIFDPLGISRNTIPPRTVLTELEINGKEIFPGDSLRGKPVMETPLRHAERIVLPYDCNSLSFRFAALHYEHPEMNRYRFRLEGSDNMWHYTDGRNSSATYLNLKHGKYVFSVYGANSDGVWSEEPARLAVTIRPPLWKSTGAMFLYFCMGLGMLYFLKTSVQRRNRQHYELEMEHKLRLEEEQRNENEMKFHTDFLHEIKTPLTLITTPVNELLENANIGKTTRDRLLIVRRSTMILQKLLDTVTDLRKYDNGNIRLHVVEVNFCRFVEEIAMLFVPTMKKHGIAFTLDLPETPVILFIDKMEMEKVLMNLLSNAIRYSPETGGDIRLSVRKDDSRGYDGVLLSVFNTGMGIMPEDLEKIFVRFHQGVNNNLGKGMGIGLAVSKHIVALHGGEIYAESVPGRNAVFYLRLRTGDAHFDESEIDRDYSNSDNPANYEALPEIPDEASARHSWSSGKTYTVLVADDSPDLRDYLGKFLSLHYNVIMARDGREGYEKAIADQPDIIISDVIMPEMDGMELCQRIKSNPDTSHIPVILLSARSLPVDKIEGLEALADDYMTKPFHTELLISRIDNLIRQRESIRESFRNSISVEPSAISGTTSDERFLKNLISVIEEHIPETEFGVDELCEEIGLSRPTLYRKIKSLTGLSAIRFMRSIRLKRAAQMLASDENLSVSSVMYSTGFNNISYFSKIFYEEFHVLPKDYRRDSRTGGAEGERTGNPSPDSEDAPDGRV